jgi:hypothetical protein
MVKKIKVNKILNEKQINSLVGVHLPTNYFKTIIKCTYEEAVGLMVALLGAEGLHSAVEGQARYVYGKNKSFNPDWKLKKLGYCDPNCTFCKDYKNIVWKALEKMKNEKNSG